MFRKTLICLILVLSLFCPTDIILAWDDETTHKDMAEKAFNYSVLNQGYLKNIGLNETAELLDWIKEQIKEGAWKEDAGNILNGRYYNHFHDPTKAWDQAGLSTIYPGVNGKSSVLWAQDVSNDWSWQKVRDCYSLALTSQTESDRKTNFANTFIGLGHIIHLVQDTSQPAHVRNDPHGLEALGLVEGFESWAKSPDNRSTVLSLMSNPIPPSFSVNIPITQFWDTNQYTGSNPSNSTSLGLSEYTNANFFSEDTIFSFPYPAWSGVVEYDEIIDANTGEERTYLRKTSDGETVEHLAAARWFYRYLPAEYKAWGLKLDDQCYSDYVSLLIPRAVGYSAGLLNYFFRGKVNMEKDPQNAGKYIIKNESGEKMEGTFALYYDDASGNRNAVSGASWILTINPNSTSSPVTFTEPTSPAPKEKGKYILVFQGKLGMEEGAVVGKVVDLNPVWEDWEKGLTGRHQWNLTSNVLDFTVVTGFGDNISKVLKITNGGQLLTPYSAPSPKGISFDYFVKSFSTDEYAYIEVAIYGLDRYSGYPRLCPLGIANSGHVDGIYDFVIKTNSWEHLSTGINWNWCSSRISKIDAVKIRVSRGFYNLDFTPLEVYIDNIDLEW